MLSTIFKRDQQAQPQSPLDQAGDAIRHKNDAVLALVARDI